MNEPDDTALYRELFRSKVGDQFDLFLAKSPAEKQAWIKRWLPKHILDALPFLPVEQRHQFLAQEVYRRIAELGQLVHANPAKVIRAEAARLGGAHKGGKERAELLDDDVEQLRKAWERARVGTTTDTAADRAVIELRSFAELTSDRVRFRRQRAEKRCQWTRPKKKKLRSSGSGA